ncbi:MAG: MFS transporter [Bacillota bacterium]
MSPLFVLGLLEFVRGALVFSLLPFYGQYAAGFGLGVIGTAISLHYLFDNAIRLPAGWLVDRFGGKGLVASGIVISCAGVLLIYFHWNAFTFILGAALFGFGVSPVWPAVISGVAAKMPSRQIGETLSKVFIAWLVGTGVGPVVLNLVVGKSYGIAFFIIFGILAIAFLITVVTEPPRIVVQKPLYPSVFLKELCRELITLKALYPGMFVQTLSIGILMPVLAIYARQEFGLNPSQLNYLLIGGGIFTVLLLVPAGKFVDRLGVKWPLAGGFLLAAICLVLLSIQKAVIMILIVGAFLGISYAIILPAWNGLMARAVSPEKRGTMWAVFMTIEGMGTASGAYIGGKVWDALGRQAPFYASALFLTAMAAFYAFSNIEKLIKENRKDMLIEGNETSKG